MSKVQLEARLETQEAKAAAYRWLLAGRNVTRCKRQFRACGYLFEIQVVVPLRLRGDDVCAKDGPADEDDD